MGAPEPDRQRSLLDRRHRPRAAGVAVVLVLFVASFFVGGDLHPRPDAGLGAIYPVMSDAGVAYATLAFAVLHWAKFLLLGLLFVLTRGWRSAD